MGVWGVVIVVLSVMRVVGGIPLRVVCVFRRADDFIMSTVFCVICSLLMFVSDASGDHMVETYSSMYLFPIIKLIYISLLSVILGNLKRTVYLDYCFARKK